jgi:YVTN family beta-propeller protein
MQFAMLGPLQVSLNGSPADLGGPKQRALLAFLLLHANTAVSRDQLIDGLWGEHPPPSAAESLDVYLSRLRKLVGHNRLSRQAGGYVLRVEPGELDTVQFERMITSAREGAGDRDAADVARELAAALALWRGRALADLASEPFAQDEIRRLEQERLTALEDRVDAELRMGRGAELVPELEQLAAEHPERERLAAALMLALYRAGRQTDALAAYQGTRRRLVQEFAVEPGPELRELQRRILQHDPTLGQPRRLVVAVGRQGRRVLAVAAVLVLAAAVALGFVVHSGAARTRLALPAGANGLVAVDSGSDSVASTALLSSAPGAVAGGAGSTWVADPAAAAVLRINPVTGAVVDRIPVGGQPGSIVTGAGAVWVASAVGATVTRINSASETVTQTITLPGSDLAAIAFGNGRLWVADSVARELFEIDPMTGSLERTLPLGLQPSAVTLGGGAIWVAGYSNATVDKIAPASGHVIGHVHVGNGPVALAFGDGSLWVANSLDSTVSRVAPATLAVEATVTVGSGPSAIAVSGPSVWVANQYSGTVSRIGPRRDQLMASVTLGGAPTSLAVAAGRLWVAVAANGGTHRGGTLVLLTTNSWASVDPALFNVTEPPQFGGLAYDTLVTFQHTGGTDGLRLVPDLALAMPTAGDGGRTYAFRIRPGIRYSDGQPLRASDFRRAIERLFRLGSPGSSYYTGIAGAAACAQHPASCDLSRGITTDDAAGTVVFHLTAPDPDFLFKLTEQDYTAPVPPGTPGHDTGSHPIPGTGPYRIAAVDHAQVRFVRNPFFREWSHAAQPDGNPDVIVWRYLPSEQAAVTAIEHGHGDWFVSTASFAQFRQLQLQDPSLLHSNPEFEVDFAPLNTHRTPFNDPRVRRALNYAINRNKIVRLYGGPSFATPTCQPLAPGLPGYGRYCPYTLHPRPGGAWTAPDLAKAQRLVTASGTRGERISVWGASDGYVPPTVPAYIADILRTLGYRVQLHLVPLATITQAMRRRFQLSVDGDWLVDYPDPSSYLPQFFSCGGGNSNGYYCNPALDRRMHQAVLLELTNPPKARTLWESIDHQLTSDAPWVPTVNERDVELISARLRNYQYNPIWGFLADQAWLRKPPTGAFQTRNFEFRSGRRWIRTTGISLVRRVLYP